MRRGLIVKPSVSMLGLCSRREAERRITSGWVKVNGAVIDTLGARLPPDAHIEIDPAAREYQSQQVTIAAQAGGLCLRTCFLKSASDRPRQKESLSRELARQSQ